MKKCENCSIEFEPKHQTRGSEQKYCSIKCRQASAQIRMINRIKENAKQESKQENENETISDNRGNQQSMDRGQPREYTRTTSGVGIISDNHLATIKELYEAKTETNFYKLKCESLEKEINELRIENSQLESELDEIENDINESTGNEYSGMLGGIMEQFKQDPVNTVNFATELIGTLFKPKKNGINS